MSKTLPVFILKNGTVTAASLCCWLQLLQKTVLLLSSCASSTADRSAENMVMEQAGYCLSLLANTPVLETCPDSATHHFFLSKQMSSSPDRPHTAALRGPSCQVSSFSLFVWLPHHETPLSPNENVCPCSLRARLLLAQAGIIQDRTKACVSLFILSKMVLFSLLQDTIYK